MTSSPFDQAARLVAHLEAMTPEERDRISRENVQRTAVEHERFLAYFSSGNCYICGNPLTSFSKKVPCLHWLLRPKGFKKHDLPEVAKRFGFFQIQTYLRWVANTHAFARNVNDLEPEDGDTSQLIGLTIRYRNLEWYFSCAESDYAGHATSQHAKHPHYHFQMRMDQRPFISYSDFHVPFSESDILSLEARRRLPDIVKHKFPRGEGMSEVLTEENLEALVMAGKAADNEGDAPIHLDTFVMADEGTMIRGEDLYDIIQEAKEKGVTVSSLMHKLPNAKTRVMVTPGPGVVDQAPRSGGRKKGA